MDMIKKQHSKAPTRSHRKTTKKGEYSLTEVFPIISETFWPLQGQCESRDLELQ